MKKAILACAFLIGLCANAQKDSLVAKNTVYLEALGNSHIASLSYERLFNVKKLKFALSLGMIIYPERIIGVPKSKTDLMYPFILPAQISFLYGKRKQFETGIGVTLININYDVNFYEGFTEVYKDYMAMIKLFGLRFQKKGGGGLFGRLNINFSYTFYTTNPNGSYHKINFLWPGASIGYTFKSRKR